MAFVESRNKFLGGIENEKSIIVFISCVCYADSSGM